MDSHVPNTQDESRPVPDAVQDVEMNIREKKITILQCTDDGKAATFQLHQEDHTLGNALRYIVMKNPAVEFCGYSIPHPSEPKMNFRIQTWEDGDILAGDALIKGVDDLLDMCIAIESKFIEELKRS